MIIIYVQKDIKFLQKNIILNEVIAAKADANIVLMDMIKRPILS